MAGGVPQQRYRLPLHHVRHALRVGVARGAGFAVRGRVSFLHPWMLLGLGAATIPLILHLIARRQPPTVVFPAVRYLVDTTREHQRRLRLRNLLLLLIRTLLIVALVLAASGPSVPISGVPGHAPSALVVIIDNSVSSGAVAGGFPQAKLRLSLPR